MSMTGLQIETKKAFARLLLEEAMANQNTEPLCSTKLNTDEHDGFYVWKYEM